jgi:hypothetical protein
MATNNLDFTSMPFPEDATIAARYDRVISNWGAAEAPGCVPVSPASVGNATFTRGIPGF